MVTDVPVGQAQLADGRYLDCISSRSYSQRLVLDCDWSNPSKERDPAKELFGNYQVFQKSLSDGRVLDCIAFKATSQRTIDNCDWEHPKRLEIVDAPK